MAIFSLGSPLAMSVSRTLSSNPGLQQIQATTSRIIFHGAVVGFAGVLTGMCSIEEVAMDYVAKQ